MRQTIVRATVLSAFALLLVGGGALAWHLRERTRGFYTDAGELRMPAADARLRDIVWLPAAPIADAVNTEADEYEPRVTHAGGTLFFVRGRTADNADILTSERTGAGWSEPVSLEAVNGRADELGPEPSPDGQVLYFYSNRAGGHGGYDLWSVRRTAGGWDKPRNLGPEVNTEHNEYGPALAPDGLTMYFASDRPAPPVADDPADADPTADHPGAPRGGGYDIYATTITTAGPIGVEPVMALNTPFNDGAPAFTPQGDFVYFASDRPGGYGGFDLYRARRLGRDLPDGLGAPERLDSAINTAADELDPSIGLGGFELIFSSNRLIDDASGDYNVFVALSKEVFAVSETYRAEIDWAALLAMIGPFLLYLLVMALGIFALMKLQTRHKRLTLIARCLLGSVLAHVLILLCMSAWTVTTSLVGALREGGGTKVVLESSAVGRDLSGQLRGGLVEVTSSSPATPPTERARTAVTSAPPVSQHTQAVAHVVIEHQTMFEPPMTSDASAAPARMPARPDHTPPTRRAERLPVAVPAAPVQVTAVESGAATPTSPIAERPAEDAAPREVPTDPTPPAAAVAMSVAPADLTTHHASRRRFVRPPSPREATIPERDTPPPPPVHLATNVTVDRGIRVPSGRDRSRPERHQEAGVQVTALGGTREPQSRATRANPASFRAEHVQTAPTAASATPDTPSFAVARASAAPTPPPHELTPRLAHATAVATPVTPTLALPGGGATRAAAREEAARADATSVSTRTEQDRRRVAVARDADESDRVDVTPAIAAFARPNSLLVALPPSTIDIDPVATFAVAGEDGSDLPRMTRATTAHAPRLMAVDTTTNEPERTSDLIAGLPAASRGRLDETALRHGDRLDEIPIEVATPEGLRPAAALASLVEMRVEEASPEPAQVIAKAERPRLAFRPLLSPELLAFRDSLPETKVPRKMQYVQRSAEHRRERIREMGGSPETERAVAMSLAWLARHQSEDGHWDGRNFDDHCGRCPGAASVDANVALTGLTLLAFLTANHTHLNNGPYRHPIDRALEWLVEQQSPDGGWIGRESMYSQGIATMAIAEAYGMTGDPDLQEPLERAVKFIFESRNRTFGGWRYKPGQIGDTSVLGWQIMALTSARRAGIAVPEEAFDVARRWLPRVRDPSNPGLYAYQPTQNPTPAMTAEALMVHQMLGADRDEPHMQDSAEYLIRFLPRWKQNTTYFWYYATLALFQHGGFEWERWNDAMREQLLSNRQTEGESAGSWSPEDKWATAGGRVYQTAICTLTLEVYYRYLPLYVRERISRR